MIDYFLYAFIQAVIMTAVYGRRAIEWNYMTPLQFFLNVFALAPFATIFQVVAWIDEVEDKVNG